MKVEWVPAGKGRVESDDGRFTMVFLEPGRARLYDRGELVGEAKPEELEQAANIRLPIEKQNRTEDA